MELLGQIQGRQVELRAASDPDWVAPDKMERKQGLSYLRRAWQPLQVVGVPARLREEAAGTSQELQEPRVEEAGTYLALGDQAGLGFAVRMVQVA